jgi:hypothetical protein
MIEVASPFCSGDDQSVIRSHRRVSGTVQLGSP